MTMHPSLNIALKAARSAAEILSQQMDRLDRIRIIESPSQTPLCSTQIEAEKLILQALQKAFPRHGFRSASEGSVAGTDPSAIWQVDGLVGAENFLRGTPGFLVSVSCEIDGATKLAVLIDPLFNEEFTTVRGSGASLNGKRVRVTARTRLDECLVALPAADTAPCGSLAAAGAELRVSGCGILDICYVAAGRYDGAIVRPPEYLARPAAMLLVREAGGLVSDLLGNPEASGETLVIGNPKCFKQILQAVRQAGGPQPGQVQ